LERKRGRERENQREKQGEKSFIPPPTTIHSFIHYNNDLGLVSAPFSGGANEREKEKARERERESFFLFRRLQQQSLLFELHLFFHYCFQREDVFCCLGGDSCERENERERVSTGKGTERERVFQKRECKQEKRREKNIVSLSSLDDNSLSSLGESLLLFPLFI